MAQALELNPRDFSVLQQIALTYEALGRYKEMAATLDRVLAITPNDVPSQVRRALVDLEGRADVKPFETTIDAILADDPNAALGLVNPWLLVVLREHDSGGVQRALSNMGEGGCFDENIPFPNDWCVGLTAWVHGDQSAARAAFENARKELAERYTINRTMRLRFAHLVWSMPYSGTRRMRFAKANVRSNCRQLAKTPSRAQRWSDISL